MEPIDRQFVDKVEAKKLIANRQDRAVQTKQIVDKLEELKPREEMKVHVEIITLKGAPFIYEDFTPEQLDDLKPTTEELTKLIEPLIPEVKDGNDYILTEKDKNEIAQKVKAPTVEKVIEKTEVIKEQPIVTNEIREVAITETPEQIAEKLQTLKESWLEVKSIKGLDKVLGELGNNFLQQAKGFVSKTIRGMGDYESPYEPVSGSLLTWNNVKKKWVPLSIVAGSNITITTNSDGTITISSTGGGVTNTWVSDEVAAGSGTSFTVGSTPVAGTVRVYGAGGRLKLTDDYTISGTTITTVNSWSTGDILLDYMTAGGTGFVDNEVVSGSTNTFTLGSTPIAGTEHIYALGQRLKLTDDYSISGATITTVNSFSAGDLIADYVTTSVSTNVDSEVVSGSATTFTLANTPLSSSVQVYARGQRLTPTVDYSISGSTITTINSWSAGDIVADYRK